MKSLMKLALIVMVLLVVLVKYGGAQQSGGIYRCLGGCYNQCILRDGVDLVTKAPCYFGCATRCFAATGPAYQYYCRLGCSLFQCSRFTSDGAKLEPCLQDCNRNICERAA